MSEFVYQAAILANKSEVHNEITRIYSENLLFCQHSMTCPWVVVDGGDSLYIMEGSWTSSCGQPTGGDPPA
jgi:hypothetical protein